VGGTQPLDPALDRGELILTEPGELWGDADYEQIARRFAPVHEALVEALEPEPGESVLDVATGTGGVALRAAHSGARVSALDIAPEMLERARAKAAGGGLEIDWVEGDAQSLPYEDSTFDIVASSFGVIFAPDAGAAAAELARVCRVGGRLGLATWKPNEGLHRICAALGDDSEDDDPTEYWSDQPRLQDLLGDAFELRVEERVWKLEGSSPEDVWKLMTTAAPPVKAFVATLEPDRLADFRTTMLDHWADFEHEGRVVEPHGYLLVLGRRR
jgi:ubiquinone/menaquinone biosynthesis C-methylase UbiE